MAADHPRDRLARGFAEDGDRGIQRGLRLTAALVLWVDDPVKPVGDRRDEEREHGRRRVRALGDRVKQRQVLGG